ncbi:MAG TPA: DUF5103 domain-containing protein [Bacteroidales bacterium]|nr:DUF5103 domain-containing protein [Bacteroidales bacterium]
MKIRLLIAFLCSFFIVQAQNNFSTRIFAENVKTLQIKMNENPLELPIISLNENDVLEISFDEMSHERYSYSYEIKHCNADWTISSLSSAEYIQGFARGYIDDYALSINTTFLYTNYRFSLPNNDVKFLVSGNYVAFIYEDNNTSEPIVQVCFSVVEPSVEIDARVRGNTDTEINNTKQQLDFDILFGNYRIQDPHSEVKVVVRQNDRLDNQVTDIKPTYYSVDKLSYVNNRNLIFEGGNEYRRFDFSSIYNYDERIDRIKFERPYYNVYLTESNVRQRERYQVDFDANGRFIINHQDGYESADLEADYMFVHFYLPVYTGFLDADIYLGGFWNYNLIDETAKMDFDSYNNLYYKTLLLKQGGYNYQFWTVRNKESKAYVAPIEGSHWQTQNQYTIYVYHRPWGGRYDKLVGVKILQ